MNKYKQVKYLSQGHQGAKIIINLILDRSVLGENGQLIAGVNSHKGVTKGGKTEVAIAKIEKIQSVAGADLIHKKNQLAHLHDRFPKLKTTHNLASILL